MKVITVEKGNKKMLIGETIEDLKSPVKITITIEEESYKKFKAQADYYKWSIYELLEKFFEDAEILIPAMEYQTQFGEYQI